jgi:hypothetical protein
LPILSRDLARAARPKNLAGAARNSRMETSVLCFGLGLGLGLDIVYTYSVYTTGRQSQQRPLEDPCRAGQGQLAGFASMGTRELAVFDPLRAGPAGLGGPVALQLWRRDEGGVLERVMAADRPAYSDVLDAWLVPRERLLEIADDPHGRALWLTTEDHARAAKEREKAARLELERRLALLEAERR